MSAVDEIIEKVSGLTVLELAECIKKMEEKFGVSAAAAVAVAAPAEEAGGQRQRVHSWLRVFWSNDEPRTRLHHIDRGEKPVRLVPVRG